MTDRTDRTDRVNRTGPGRAARAAALLIAGLALTAGCRIPETGVVQAGEPATGVRAEAFVYLVLDGRLVPVFRRARAAPVDEAGAVAMVLRDLTPDERQAGLSTRLPSLPAGAEPPRVTVNGDRISVELSFAKPLEGLAMAQLVCTVADARTVTNPDADPAALTVTLVMGETRARLKPGPGPCAEGIGVPEGVWPSAVPPLLPAPATGRPGAEPAEPTVKPVLPTAEPAPSIAEPATGKPTTDEPASADPVLFGPAAG
ncbi:hypothetical protein [Streptomyces paludis]|uniref:GerMN domain-containing protein n=1 Tax=Streptomyces paludis TaxID=2282738 RepID=A0A345HI30_9ACTN|nr:hypothetical protein [Streptomyces paludis]AXG76354.1 hypothetical protein DVK44_00175 [Streptomyces paludis]